MTTGLHNWERNKPSEPLSCTQCGVYYASTEGSKPCQATLEACECSDGGHDAGDGVCMCGGVIDGEDTSGRVFAS